MPIERIEKSWKVRFKGIETIVVNDLDRDAMDRAIEEARAQLKLAHPEIIDFEIQECAYNENHLGPIVEAKKRGKR